MPIRPHRNYNRIAITQDADVTSPDNNGHLNEPLSPSSSLEEAPVPDEQLQPLSCSSAPPINNEISVVLLDGAQTKFNINCDPQWKVSEFKEVSSDVTKVPPQSQRLIHMGKLLQDEKTLGECGIDASDKIIHLFPKPNVVINASTASGDEESSGAQSNESNNPSGRRRGEGAHVPQIVLDAEEASRRSQILILSSQEIFEAQHRVKIFSFLLMIITSMELLTLMTLYAGVDQDPYGTGSEHGEIPPGNPTDAPPSTSNTMQIRTWQNSDYADAVISAFGFYVSLLGIKATTENTLLLAKRYLGCLVVAGIASNCYYFYLNVQQMEKNAQERSQTIDDTSLYGGSFVGILLPLTVWMLCIIRAYQFQMLIREAETEAEERTRGLVGSGSTDAGERTSSSLPYGSGESGVTSSSSAYNDLELQVEQEVSS
jgi:ubiquitin-like protein Nedd8